MPFVIRAKDEIDAILKVVSMIEKEGTKSSRYNELLNCLLSIQYSEKKLSKFREHKLSFLDAVGKTAGAAFKRADRLYNDNTHRMTKPNYWKRMHEFDDIINGRPVLVNQIENIIFELSTKPKNSVLSFSIFRPVDIIKKKRQGYVPCPISGDFKFRNGELQLNVFFRSNDALNFLYPDIYYLRRLQVYVLNEVQKQTKYVTLKAGKLGKLNIYFSRIYLPLRMEMSKREYVNKTEIALKKRKLINALQKIKDVKV